MTATDERPEDAPGEGAAPGRPQRLAEWAPIGQAVYDLEGVLLNVNQAWASLLDHTPAEVIGTNAKEYVHPDDLDHITAEAVRLFKGEIDHIYEERRLRRKNGSFVWVSSSITVEREPGGNAEHFHSLIIDINERKQAEQALRESEARYRKLIREAPVPQLVSELDGTLVEFNHAFLALMRATPEQLLTRAPVELVHPEDRQRLATEVSRLRDGDIDYFDIERRLVRPDGSIVWVTGGTSLVHDGDQVHLHTAMQDIHERKEAGDALRESEARYRAVIDSLHDGLIVHTDRDVLAANASAARIMGVDTDRLLDAEHLLEVGVVDADGEELTFDRRPSMQTLADGRARQDVVQGIQALDGELRWCLTNSMPLFHPGDEIPYAVALSFTDFTDRKNAMDALRESEIRFRTLADSLPVGVFHADVTGRFDYANPQWRDITDIPLDEVTDPSTVDIIHPDDRPTLWRELGDALRNHRPYHVQYRIRRGDGSIRWLNGRGSNTFDPETGEATGIVGSIEDITPLVAAQEQTARLAGIVESTSDLVGIVDWHSGNLIYLNRAARELFGRVDQDISGIHHLDLFTPDALDAVVNSLIPALEKGEVWSGELPMWDADRSVLHVWQTIAADRTPEGTIYQLSAVGRDVTQRRQFERELAWQATHDSLTRLPNRALLLDHLELGLARAERDGKRVALLFADLDRFKQVNDTLGHDAGDDLLAQTARRIAEVLRPSDTVARLGGDEFVILAEDVEDENHAMTVGQRIARAIDATPFVLLGQELDVTASIGIAVSGEVAAHPEALLRDADAAMYRAKDLGRARLELFDEKMRLRAQRRNELADQLAIGLEDDNITVYYQPCVDLTTGRITSVEALARWEHPERGILSPYEFIALAEDTGLIVGLGLIVLAKACRRAHEWEERFGVESPRVHVNLSARQLTATNLPTLVAGVLDGSGLSASKLCLEITESVLMDDAPSVIDTLWALKGIGVSLAIDDFGTGYSSLSYLRRFPVDVLKVDQSFVDGLGPDPEDSAIVAAIVNLANTLELDAVAEGVETREQLERLRALGCNGAQGFYFTEPRPPEEIEALFDKAYEV